jgi:hypothetical protein
LEEPLEYDEEYCFKCCAEYGTNEPCPECDCSEIIDELLDEEDLFFYDGDEELWDWDEEDEEV